MISSLMGISIPRPQMAIFITHRSITIRSWNPKKSLWHHYSDCWIPLTKGQQCRKHFHGMTPSWRKWNGKWMSLGFCSVVMPSEVSLSESLTPSQWYPQTATSTPDPHNVYWADIGSLGMLNVSYHTQIPCCLGSFHIPVNGVIMSVHVFH